MIRAALLSAVLVSAISAPSALHGSELDHERLADAIRIREGWQGRDGAKGERGPYQLTWKVWRDRMHLQSWSLARSERQGRQCALSQIVWLSEQIEAAGLNATPFNIALAWNAGLSAVLAGRAPVSSYHYATDVANLYASP